MPDTSNTPHKWGKWVEWFLVVGGVLALAGAGMDLGTSEPSGWPLARLLVEVDLAMMAVIVAITLLRR